MKKTASYCLSVASLLIFCSCASMFNKERQQVKFKGGPEKGITKVLAPDGTFEIENGSGAYMMTRTKSDIPLRIKCPDGSTKNATAETYYTWKLGWLNIFNYGIGFLEAAFSDSAYSIEDISLFNLCNSASIEAPSTVEKK